jgi:hypothetical protein
MGVRLGQVLLEEGEVLISTLTALLGIGDLAGSLSADDGLGRVELGELAGEVRRKCWALGRGGGGVVTDEAGVGVLGLEAIINMETRKKEHRGRDMYLSSRLVRLQLLDVEVLDEVCAGSAAVRLDNMARSRTHPSWRWPKQR